MSTTIRQRLQSLSGTEATATTTATKSGFGFAEGFQIGEALLNFAAPIVQTKQAQEMQRLENKEAAANLELAQAQSQLRSTTDTANIQALENRIAELRAAAQDAANQWQMTAQGGSGGVTLTPLGWVGIAALGVGAFVVAKKLVK